jgi:dihydrofolate synthase/folylpolyglutamate synthase
MSDPGSNLKPLQWLASLVNYEATRAANYTAERGSLAGYLQLLLALGSPNDRGDSIIVAGSKGKGTVTTMLEAFALAAELHPATFLSPHILRTNERLRLSGADVSDLTLDNAIRSVASAAESCSYMPSWFEAIIAASLVAAGAGNFSPLLLEVGLGGRLDATNVTSPRVAVITRIVLEHTAVLGDTLGLIAAEKAAVISPGSTAVVLGQDAAVLHEVRLCCNKVGARIVVVDTRQPSEWLTATELDLLSRSRLWSVPVLREDLILAAVAWKNYIGQQLAVDPAPFHRLACRYDERAIAGRTVLLDAAHTAESVAALLAYSSLRYGRFELLFAALADKDVTGMLTAAGAASGLAKVHMADLTDARAFSATKAIEVWRGLSQVPAALVAEADEADASSKLPLVVCGSFRLLSSFMRANGIEP